MSEGQEHTPKPRIIQFKGEQDKMQRVNLGKLGAIFANIEAHNKEFSLGSMLAKGLISHFKEKDEKPKAQKKGFLAKFRNPFSRQKDRGDAVSEALGIIHADSFSPIGISFDTASETEVKLMTQDEEIAETKIKFGLHNPDLFLSFLDAVGTMDKKELSDGVITPLMSKIGYDLASQIYLHYGNFIRDERVSMIAPKLDEIVSRYKKLGIKAQYEGVDRTEELENYAKYSKQGILEEYAKANIEHLFAKPNDEEKSFSTLANWSYDIDIEKVQERWEKAVSVLGQIKSNPKAKELVVNIKANLAHCIEAALKDINSKDEAWDRENEWAKRKEKREIFENAKINIQMI